ncbi:MAG: cyclase family protein [bacterium]|nr:cyclase family protein [bacterium]
MRSFPLLGIACLVLTIAACASPAPAPEEATAVGGSSLDVTTARVIDLTHAFDDQTIYWPTSPTDFELTNLAHGPTAGGYFYFANSFCAPEHGGTHLDAPVHFGEGKWTADEIPVERLMGAGVVIDVRRQAAEDPDYRLTPEEVRTWEAEHGDIPAGAIVLLHTGWDKFWPERRQYLGDDTPGDASNLHFPSYGREAAEYLIRERQVAILGVDTASIDYGPSSDFPVPQVVGAASVLGLENVAHLDQLPATGSWIIALPMKIAGGSGGPVRIVALVQG